MSMGGRGRYTRGTTEAQIIERANREYERSSQYRATKQLIRNTTPKEPKTMSLEDYEPVAVRLKRLLDQLASNGLIFAVITQMLSEPGADICVFRAELWVDGILRATGHAEEVRGQGNVNRTSHVENCETSSIGRMVEFFTPTADHTKRPSREEMSKVQRMTSQPVTPREPTNEPLRIKGTQHGPIPQWAIDDAAEQGITLVYDNRDQLAANPKRPWFKCVESGSPLWAPKGTPLPVFDTPELTEEEPF